MTVESVTRTQLFPISVIPQVKSVLRAVVLQLLVSRCSQVPAVCITNVNLECRYAVGGGIIKLYINGSHKPKDIRYDNVYITSLALISADRYRKAGNRGR